MREAKLCSCEAGRCWKTPCHSGSVHQAFIFGRRLAGGLKSCPSGHKGDAPLKLLNDAVNSTDFKTKANASVTWSKGDWSATIYVERYGHTPNYLATIDGFGTPGAGLLGSWTLSNLSARYQVTPTLGLSFNVDNLFNTMPPVDHSYAGTAGSSRLPPYNTLDYNVFGRSYFVEASYKFGK